MKKKLLMILLSVVMVVSMLPATSFAGEAIYGSGDAFIVQGTGAESSVALTWTKAEKASKYKVFYKKATAKKFKLAKATKAQKLTLKNLANNTYYKVYVTVLNKKGKKVAKTATIKVATGNAIKFQYAGDTPIVIYDGVIPYDSWAKAVAAGWTFTANVAGNAVQAKLVEYSDNKVGVEALDGTKLGVFYNDKPRYDYNMVTLEDKVDAGHTYFVGDVWPTPAPAPEKTTKTINLVWEKDEYETLTGTVEIPYDSWSEIPDSVVNGIPFVLEGDAYLDGEKEEISTLQIKTTQIYDGRIYRKANGDKWILCVELNRRSSPEGEASRLQAIRVNPLCYTNSRTDVIGMNAGTSYHTDIVDGWTYYIFEETR